MNWKIMVAGLFLIACGAVPQTAPRPSADYSALPDSLPLPAGYIRIQIADSLKVAGRPEVFVLGRFDALTRTLYVNRRITSPQQRLKTMYHEACHITLVDSGLQNVLYSVVDPSIIELICDAWATSRMAELSRNPR